MEHSKAITMLIVDDEAAIRNGLSRAMDWEGLGINVLGTAADGIEALDIIRTQHPDIVLTDIRMPGLDGLDLIAQARSNGFDTHFVIISGYNDFLYAQKAIKYGVKSYLLKPIKKAILLEEIQGLAEELRKLRQQHAKDGQQHRHMKQVHHAMKEKFLLDLLHREYTEEKAILAELSGFETALKPRSYEILVFEYELPDDSAMEDTGFTKTDNPLFKLAFRNMVEELLGERVCEIVACAANQFAVWVQSPIGKPESSAALHSDCESILKALREHCHATAFCGIGQTAVLFNQSADAFEQAKEALSYRIYDPEKPLFDHREIYFVHAPANLSQSLDSHAIVDAILSGDRDQIRLHTQSAIQTLLYIATPPPSFLRGMCVYVFQDVQRELSRFLDDSPSPFDASPHLTLNACTSVQAMTEWMISRFCTYAAHLRMHNRFTRDPVIERAKAYILDHIDTKLHLEDVAAHVHLSESYFTAYFKEKTGENFRNHVLRLKMERAVELIRTTRKSTAEIAALLGYEDYRSFNRVFKKETGKTPSELFNAFHKDALRPLA